MTKGVLNGKLKRYYEDANLKNYRRLLTEAIVRYNGCKFNKVLDIGAGIGVFLESIESFGFDLHALEASEYGLQRMREKGIRAKEFFLENGKKLPFNDNEFSFVLFNQVIEHLDKEVGKYYIEEIIRILEPGGVAIIKSPSAYSRIWRTDPHHLYCWKPNELLNEISQYEGNISDIKLQRVTLEPWMLFRYNDHIIDTWHKYNKFPHIKKAFQVVSVILDRIISNIGNSDKMLAVSNVTFVKK